MNSYNVVSFFFCFDRRVEFIHRLCAEVVDRNRWNGMWNSINDRYSHQNAYTAGSGEITMNRMTVLKFQTNASRSLCCKHASPEEIKNTANGFMSLRAQRPNDVVHHQLTSIYRKLVFISFRFNLFFILCTASFICTVCVCVPVNVSFTSDPTNK